MASTNCIPRTSLRKVECLVCQKVVYPPVMQCKNWHLVCNNCRHTLASCPESDCQEEISCATRSGVSEKFLDKYVVRCKYFKEDGSGCMDAFSKDDTDFLTSHEQICYLREVICLVPCCNQSIQFIKLLQHFECVHFMTSNSNHTIEMNVSEIILHKKSIVNETCEDNKTNKSIPCYLKDGDDIFLAIFRISSLRQPVFEISTIIYPFYSSVTCAPKHRCKISASNVEDLDAYYKWEGPICQKGQIFPLPPVLQVQDETAKLKWDISIEIFRK